MNRQRLISLAIVFLVGACATSRAPTLGSAYVALYRGKTGDAMAQLRAIAEARPHTMEAALAIDTINEIRGRALPDRSCDCSQAAVAQYQEAELAYERRDLDSAKRGFRKAIELCPGNATWRVHAGDVPFSQGDYAAAREFYLRGLEIDPWNRAGHRFLADAELNLGNGAEAYRHLLLAVISDPTYEAGWEYLEQLTLGAGGQFFRQFEPKHIVTLQEKTIHIDLGDPSAPRVASWNTYSRMDLAARLRGQPQMPPTKPEIAAKLPPADQWAAWTPIQRERHLVGLALADIDLPPDPGEKRQSVLWPTMKAAASYGYLDEAIYMGLLDRELAGDYVAFREKHLDRLVTFLTEFVAVLPQKRDEAEKAWLPPGPFPLPRAALG